ncbi:MAG: amidase family protein [Nitrososphaeraceae archaeon]
METIREIRNSFLKLFSIQNLDAFVVPTTIIPAPRFGQEKVNVCRNVILDTRQALLRNTIVFNSIGLPLVSIPIGLTKKDNLPVGAQIIGHLLRKRLFFRSHTVMNGSAYLENGKGTH